MDRIDYDEFKRLLRSSHRAWHLERRDTYGVTSESEPLRRWLDGEPDDYAWHAEWLQFVRESTAAGIEVQRLRIVSEPHTDYTRWGMAIAPQNIKAGEDVRYLQRDRLEAHGIPVPEEDCWLLDDTVLVLSIFLDDGREGAYAREPDPALTGQYRAFRDATWRLAVSAREYIAA